MAAVRGSRAQQPGVVYLSGDRAIPGPDRSPPREIAARPPRRRSPGQSSARLRAANRDDGRIRGRPTARLASPPAWPRPPGSGSQRPRGQGREANLMVVVSWMRVYHLRGSRKRSFACRSPASRSAASAISAPRASCSATWRATRASTSSGSTSPPVATANARMIFLAYL